jgi:hypothetical protein
MLAKRIPETLLPQIGDATEPTIVEFSGMDELFGPLFHEHQFVREQLVAMTRPEIIASAGRISPVIGIHVRFGDFASAPSDGQMRRSEQWNARLPIDWYIEALQAVRLAAGYLLEATVFSDGSAEELQPLLAIPGVVRSRAGSSIADLLAMSHSKILIASGSTFSMWASYLGRMPVLWYPGQLRQRLYLSMRDLEAEYNPGERLPYGFIESTRQIPRGLA